MNIATVVLLFFTLILAPLPITIQGNVNLVGKSANVKATMYGLKLLAQKIEFKNMKLQISGTINTQMELLNTDIQDGLDFTKCFSVRAISVVTNCNLCEKHNSKMLNVFNALTAIFLPIICNFTHKRVSVINTVTFEQSNVTFRLELYTSLIASMSALIVQVLKIHKRQTKN